MSAPKAKMSDRMFSGLLRLLPFDFRSEFGSEMEEVFHSQHAEKRDRGVTALVKMWAATVADIFRMAPREHASVLVQDTRYALRMMRKNLGYTVAAVLILGLGIGANTSIFSVVNSVLLKPLPYTDGNNLVVLRQLQTKTGDPIGFSPLEVADYRQQNQSLSGVVEYHGMSFTLFGKGEAHRVRTGVVSHDFFQLFGVKPLLGRTFQSDDEKPSAQPVLVLSYEFWKDVEGGNPKIIGTVYQMNDKPHIVIGVLPPIPQYPNENDVYMPTTACPTRSSARVIANRDFHMVSVFGRLKPNQPVEFCRRDVAGVAQHLKQDYPKSYPDRIGYTANATLLREELTSKAKPMLLALLGAAAFVLLIACANVANLILARMARREQELVIRTAVGAGSGRLLRQLLTESLIMALLAAVIGIAFALGTNQLLAKFATQLTARGREIGIDGWVLAFATLCATATTVLFGSMAALYSRHEVAAGLKEGSRGAGDRSRNLVRSGLIAAQVAFSFMLLIGAGLMVRSFLQLSQVDPGFVPQRVFALGFATNWSKYGGPNRSSEEANRLQNAYSDRLLDKVRTNPGVLSAATSLGFPMSPQQVGSTGFPTRFEVIGEPRDQSDASAFRSYRPVSPDYLKVLGIPLLAGRSFRDSDTAASEQVVLINRSLAVKRWPNQDPIGKKILIGRTDTPTTIVGIVGDVREFGPERDAPAQGYYPMKQGAALNTLIVRSVGDPVAIAGALRSAVLEIDSQTAITQFETMEQAQYDSVSSPRTLTRLFTLFAALAFVIALVGIGSMLALWVRQRTRELGIRMALGASPGDVVSAVLKRGMLLTAIGLAIGFAGALGLTRLLKTLLFHVDPTDAVTFATVSGLLLAAALLACSIPARRASRIDPQTALRCD